MVGITGGSIMPLYHTSFRGRKKSDLYKGESGYVVVVECNSIYDVKEKLETKYELIRSLCITNCEAAGLSVFQIAKV